MPDESPQGNVTDQPATSPPKESDWGDMATRILDDEPETDSVEEPAEDDPDEDESETDNADDEGEAEEEDEERTRDAQGRFLPNDAKVTLKDGTVTTVQDLKDGYFRQTDYSRKTLELSKEREAFQERNRAVEQRESQLAQQFDFAEQVLTAFQPSPPDRSEIQTDPIGYQDRKAAYDEWVASWQNLQWQRGQHQEQQQQTESQRFQERLQKEENLLLERVPEFKDEAKVTAYEKDLTTYAKDYGFTRDELKIPDHRIHLVLRDAIKYRKMQAKKPQAQEKAKGKPPMTPGKRQDAKSNDARAQSRDLQTLSTTRGHGPDGDAAWERALKRSGHI
ncbi:MAG: hypothetical protein H0W99_07565 [Acidobacteria bacterium]|nr:hypothetical protein [Acidobacteriota bacterium]